MKDTARLLWKRPRRRTGRNLPFVVDVLPGLRLPASVAEGIDPTEPLATAPLGWRLITLLGVAKLLNLDSRWTDTEPLRFTVAQMIEWTEDREPRQQLNRVCVQHDVDVPGYRPLRSNTEYLELARLIIVSKEWRAAQEVTPRERRKTLNALVHTVLTPTTGA